MRPQSIRRTRNSGNKIPVPISTPRGADVDNRGWLDDPAIIVGIKPLPEHRWTSESDWLFRCYSNPNHSLALEQVEAGYTKE